MKITLDQLPNFTKEFATTLSPKADNATVIFLSGNLGAGKTTFAKALAKELGVTEEVTSPTFVIQKRYPIKFKDFKNLYHIDAYRLESGKETAVLGLEELLQDPTNLILIEWPEKIEDIQTSFHNPIIISFKVIDEATREIMISNGKEN